MSMHDQGRSHLGRRTFLRRVGVGLGGIAVGSTAGAVAENWGDKTLFETGHVFAADGSSRREKLPIAAVVTVYHTNSHADVIVGKILDGWRQDGGPGPDLKVVSIYTDQVHANDLSRSRAEKYSGRCLD